ncbi:MAG TPA: ATPase domain-containing protein [Acidobacteriota bacterium]|jgi:hypothetical protein
MASFSKRSLELLLKNEGLGSSLGRECSTVQLFPTGIESLDRLLSGGLPRGHIIEITGPISSGKTSLLISLFSHATQKGEVVACIDANQLDPFSAWQCGVDPNKLLWVRCRHKQQILKAADILCRAGNFGIIALDLHLSTQGMGNHFWFRLQRAVEGTRTILLLLVPYPLAGNAARMDLILRRQEIHWHGESSRWKLLRGYSIEIRAEGRTSSQLARARIPVQSHHVPVAGQQLAIA